ncbi:MAG: efflux RND transporter periplasmic adaptor subunit [Desulfobacterales bacterium]
MRWKMMALLGGFAAFFCVGHGALLAAGPGDPLMVDGLIEPRRVVEIGSSVPGVLETVDVERGDTVKRDQVLATLKSGVEKATLALARARAKLVAEIDQKQEQVAFMTRKQDRFEQLYKSKAVPFEKMDEARTDRALAELGLKQAIENQQMAELEMERAAAALDQRTIRSTISGVVVERYLSPGEYVEDRPILKVAQIDPLNVEVIISVEHLGKVREGMTAKVFPQEPVGGSYAAKVTVVDKVVDAASSTFGVRLELPNPQYRISAGIKCNVAFPVE